VTGLVDVNATAEHSVSSGPYTLNVTNPVGGQPDVVVTVALSEMVPAPNMIGVEACVLREDGAGATVTLSFGELHVPGTGGLVPSSYVAM
jgi:hypothetical protein